MKQANKNMNKSIQTPEKGTEVIEEEIQTSDEEAETGETEIEPDKENLGEDSETKETSQELIQKEVDYKNKFRASASENQIFREKIKELERKLGKMGKDEISVKKELEKLYPDWEEMSEFEKNLAERNLTIERRLQKVEQGFGGIIEETEREKELDNFLEKAIILDKYPELEGKEKDFREFSKKPAYKDVSLDILASAFLFRKKEEMTTPKKSSVLERGSGGPKEIAPRTKKISPEELKALRLSDYKKYKQIITEHPDWVSLE